MSKIFTFLVFIFAFSLSTVSQSLNAKITDGIRLGNSEFLRPFLMDEVELITIEREEIASRDKTIKILGEFFIANPPHSFTVVHQGASPAGASYHIGVLDTKNGKFRIYILLNKNGDHEIAEIRIEKDD